MNIEKRVGEHLEKHSDVELHHHEHGVNAQHVAQAHLDAVAAVQIRVTPLAVTQNYHTLVPECRVHPVIKATCMAIGLYCLL